MKQLIKQKYLASVFLFMASQVILLSTQTDWWADYFLVDGSTPQDTVVVTHGQAKHAVQKAYQYLEAELSEVGGAGTAITALYTTYCTNAPTDAANDRLPLSIGQLKYLTKPFYDRLNSATVAFDTSVMNPVSTDIYPWTVDQSDDADLTLATIGQLKFVFSFDLSTWVAPDVDFDGLPDWWETEWFGNLSQDQIGDFEGDGMTNLEEFENGLNPLINDSMDDPDGDNYPNIYEVRNPNGDPSDASAIPEATFVVSMDGSTGYTTLQSAIDDAAVDYSIILVKPGIYTGSGNSDFSIAVYNNDPAILIISEEGAANTILDGEGTHRGGNIATTRSSFIGFTIRKCISFGNNQGGGLYIKGDEILVAECRIHDNESIYEGGGIYTKGNNIRIKDCEIYNNRASLGAGLLCDSGVGLKIKNTKVYGNTAAFNGGGVYIEGNEVILDNCEIRENRASSNGGGIYVQGGATSGKDVLIENCEIHHNLSDNGAGLYLWNVSALKVQNTLVHRNKSVFKGGGICIYTASNTSLTHVTLYNNSASDGNEIYRYFGNATDVLLTNSIIWNDSGTTNVLAGKDVSARYSIIQGSSGYVDNGMVINTNPRLTPQALLTAASSGIAIDQGTHAGLGFDIHGEARPDGAGYDIGADEFKDSDGDRLPDWLEELGVTDPSEDEDGDGLLNLYEFENSLDLFDPDTDGDGFTDGQEVLITGTDPTVPNSEDVDVDLNSDGINDRLGASLGIANTQLNNDGDLLSNAQELALGTNPNQADSDGDGVDDGIDEFPLDPNLTIRPTNGGDTNSPLILLLTPPQTTLLQP